MKNEPQTSAEQDLDLAELLVTLSEDEQEHYRKRLSERIAAGEPMPGIEWRALVDVRRQFGHWPPPQEQPTAMVGHQRPKRETSEPDPRSKEGDNEPI
jgi:hypothetical protein